MMTVEEALIVADDQTADPSHLDAAAVVLAAEVRRQHAETDKLKVANLHLATAAAADADEIFRLQSSHSALYAEVQQLREESALWEERARHLGWERKE